MKLLVGAVVAVLVVAEVGATLALLLVVVATAVLLLAEAQPISLGLAIVVG